MYIQTSVLSSFEKNKTQQNKKDQSRRKAACMSSSAGGMNSARLSTQHSAPRTPRTSHFILFLLLLVAAGPYPLSLVDYWL
jgi:hypothetical protein